MKEISQKIWYSSTTSEKNYTNKAINQASKEYIVQNNESTQINQPWTYLQRHYSGGLEAQICFEVLGDLAHQPLEG